MFGQRFFGSYLERGEKIQMVIHRHAIFLKIELGRLGFFGLLIPAAMYYLFPQTLPFAAVWGWLGIMRMLYEYIDWYFDAWLVTNLSIVKIEWNGFFNKSAARVEYHNLESITYTVQGFWPTVLNYGDITAEKITGNVEVFHKAFRPKKKVQELLKHHAEFSTQKSVRDHRTLKNMLTDMLQAHYVKHGLPEDHDGA